MQIAKITIARLYNLGNYEHIRYELTVDVKEGESAHTAVVGLERILAGLKPLKNLIIHTAADLDRAAKEIEEMKTMPAADFERHYGRAVSAAERIKTHGAILADNRAKFLQVQERAQLARLHFDHVGGAAERTDHKLDWEDDDNRNFNL